MGKRVAREIWEYDSMAEFEVDGGAARYGDGDVVIGGVAWRVAGGKKWLRDAKIINSPEIALARYRVIPNSTARKIAWIGDSTTALLFLQAVGGFPKILANDGTDYVSKVFAYPGGPMYQVTHGNFGENGQTLSNFLNGLAAYDVNDIAAFGPDLIVFCYGINDVRLGTTTQSQLIGLITSAVNMLQLALPNTDIILRMPNSLLYDATNTGSYIDAPTSLTKVQSYSDILRNSYRAMIGQFSNCFVLDTQAGAGQIFPEKVQSTPGIYMAAATDALHPGGEGFAAIIREIMLAIGDFGETRYAYHTLGVRPLLPGYSVPETAHSTVVNANDYLVSPRVCEDSKKYNLILDGQIVVLSKSAWALVSSNISGLLAKNLINAVAQNDIVVQYGVTDTVAGSQSNAIESGVTAWKWNQNSKSVSGNNIFLTAMPNGYPLTQNYPNPLKIFRPRPAAQKYDADSNIALNFGANDFSAASYTLTAQRAGAIGNISATAGTGPTTGGTITVAVNGTTVETLTFANNGTTATGGGAFAGLWLDEGDVVTVTVNAGFAGGAKLRIKVSNR